MIELMLGEEWLDRAVAAVLHRAELQRRCRSAASMSKSGRSMRRNGWHPKPRQWLVYGRDPDEVVGAAKWEHDPAQSNMWKYLRLPDDGGWCSKEFRDEFRVPHVIFDYYYNLVRIVFFT